MHMLGSATATLDRYRALAGPEADPVAGLEEVGDRARRGEPHACEAIAVSADHLATATLILANALNPEVFVITGGMASLGPLLVEPIRERLRTGTFRGVAASTRVESGRLGIFSGAFGAVKLARDAGLGSPTR